MFNRLGSITSFKFLSGIALAMCIAQSTVNWLLNRYSKDKNFKGNASSTDGPATTNVGIDNNI